MNTIEQARCVSRELRSDGKWLYADTIDALIAELEKVTREAHENKDKARWANAELERVTTLARGQHVELYNARLELERLKSQEPVDAALLEDMVEGRHPQYGRGLFATDNCVKGVYLAAGAQPAQQSPRFNFEVLHKFAEDNRISYNGLCAAVKESLLAAPVQAQEQTHKISGKNADELWHETGRLRAELADLKVQNPLTFPQLDAAVKAWFGEHPNSEDFIERMRAAIEAAIGVQAQEQRVKSFAETHPANPNAKCKCEHWQSCAECHPTAHKAQEPFAPDWAGYRQGKADGIAEAQEQRKPLTDEQCQAVIDSMPIYDAWGRTDKEGDVNLHEFARAIEQAHLIGEQP